MKNSEMQRLRKGVHRAYSTAAESPEGEHPFPVGRRFAESVGYPAETMDALPAICAAAFSGVSNLSVSAEIPPGSVVLDLGCGAGLDSLIAAKKTGAEGRVIGVDFSRTMLARGRRAAVGTNVGHVEFREGDAEKIPLDDGEADVALVNGIFNLNPDRQAIFSELVRVVKQGGKVFAAELILEERLSEEIRIDEENWFA